MPATIQSVTTRGFGTTGGFTGDNNLVVTLGYGFGAAAAAVVPPIDEVTLDFPHVEIVTLDFPFVENVTLEF